MSLAVPRRTLYSTGARCVSQQFPDEKRARQNGGSPGSGFPQRSKKEGGELFTASQMQILSRPPFTRLPLPPMFCPCTVPTFCLYRADVVVVVGQPWSSRRAVISSHLTPGGGGSRSAICDERKGLKQGRLRSMVVVESSNNLGCSSRLRLEIAQRQMSLPVPCIEHR